MNPRRTAVLAGAAAAALLASGFGIVRWSEPAVPLATAPTLVVPTGRPVSCATAAGDARSAVLALGGRRALDPASRGPVLTEWVDGAARGSVEDRLAAGDATARAVGLLGGSPGPVITVVAPLGVQLVSCRAGQASARVWVVSLLGTTSFGELACAWSTEAVDLVASPDRWQVAAYTSTPGPVPVQNQPATDLDTALSLTAGMEGTGDAPR